MILFPTGERDFSLLHSVQTRSGARSASNPTGIGPVSYVVKRPGSEDDHSSLSSAEVKKVGAVPPLPHTSSLRNV
jgi:hypothetical protein